MDSNLDENDHEDEEELADEKEDNDDVASVDSMSDLFPGKLFFLEYKRLNIKLIIF